MQTDFSRFSYSPRIFSACLLFSGHSVQKSKVGACAVTGYCSFKSLPLSGPPGGGVLPYNGLMGTCGQPGYGFRDSCLKQGIDFINFVLNRVSFLRQEPITLFLDLRSDACGFNSGRILNSKLKKEKNISIKMNLSETFLDKYTRE